MKKIGAVNLGLAFAGAFLGAGYVSGQELWQFFGVFGKNGIYGLCLAMLILFALGVVMIELNRLPHIQHIDALVIERDIRPLRVAVTVLECVFLFGVCVIMSAGVGALLNQLFGLPTWLGSAVFTVVVSLVSLRGLGGMVAAFSATVPVLAAATFVFGLISFAKNGVTISDVPVKADNPLLGSWAVAAITFACYNLFGSIAMISPLGEYTKSKKSGLLGLVFGTAVLFIIAGSVLVSLSTNAQAVSAELPMLALALGKSRALGLVYGALMLLAMFGSSLSSLVGFANILAHKFESVKTHRKIFTAVCCVGMILGSLFGFGELIGTVYPIFGYCSSIFIVTMTVHYLKVRRKNNEQIEHKA